MHKKAKYKKNKNKPLKHINSQALTLNRKITLQYEP